VDFGRVVTAMVTPFDENLRVNWVGLERLIDHLIDDQKTDSILVCGTTGESPTLSEDEKLELFERSVKHANGRCKIIAGTGGNNTEHSVHLTLKAEEAGVDGILLVAPYYNKPTQEGLYRHFKTIAEATKLPIMLYNIPGRSVVNITAETTIRLAELPNVVAMKESSGNLEQITQIISGTSEDFKVYSGDDSLTLPVLSVGGYGIVSVASHVVGRNIQEMIRAYVNGEVKKAAELHWKLLPVFKGLFICPNPVPVKYALNIHGANVGGVRLPLVEATKEEEKCIRELFQ
jgi:4-hydroxy-tetrahydrodipicolinate synthase